MGKGWVACGFDSWEGREVRAVVAAAFGDRLTGAFSQSLWGQGCVPEQGPFPRVQGFFSQGYK